ncbi:MAG: peptidylprolyl isomerase [Phycisphaerales bacterium]
MKKFIAISLLILGIVVFAAVAFVVPSGESTQGDIVSNSSTQTTPEAVSITLPVAAQIEQPAEPAAVQEDTMVYVAMETTEGTMYIGLNETKAPITVANYLSYVDDGFYTDTVFHRVMKGFMVQGGGFAEGLKKKETKAEIKNEWQNGLKNMRGTLAMARLGRQPDSASSQFFINLVDNPFLDQPRDGAGYAVFGHVVKGLDVLDAIGSVPTAPQGMHGDVPVDAIFIKSVTRLTPEQIEELELAGAEG